MNLSEPRRISLIHDLPMTPGYIATDPGGGDSLPSSSSSISSQVEHGDDMEPDNGQCFSMELTRF